MHKLSFCLESPRLPSRTTDSLLPPCCRHERGEGGGRKGAPGSMEASPHPCAWMTCSHWPEGSAPWGLPTRWRLSPGLGLAALGVRPPSPLFTTCVLLARLLHVSEPRFPHLRMATTPTSEGWLTPAHGGCPVGSRYQLLRVRTPAFISRPQCVRQWCDPSCRHRAEQGCRPHVQIRSPNV